jgi:hypothetical protein
MIVDGRTEFTGNDSGKAARAITEAAKSPKGKIEITRSGDKIIVKLAELPEHSEANVFLAIAEDNLSTKVGRGENSGKTLEHLSVVRELKSVRALKSGEKAAEIETNLTFGESWKKENLKIIVFVQENESRKILGVGRIPLAEK